MERRDSDGASADRFHRLGARPCADPPSEQKVPAREDACRKRGLAPCFDFACIARWFGTDEHKRVRTVLVAELPSTLSFTNREVMQSTLEADHR